MHEDLLTLEEAAARLRTPTDTLRYWRAHDKGPVSIKIGRRIFYSAAECDRYVAELFEAARREPVSA